MKFIKRTVTLLPLLVLLIAPFKVSAATSPGLGQADSFVILSSTYSNTVSGTTLNGALGYTVPPAVAPTVNGDTHSVDSVYTQAGIDQNTALVALNNQPCTYSFPPGNIDLGIDTTHGPVGVYQPGVYCIDGAATIGGGSTITLDGAGTYIFLVTGALTTSANSIVTLANGASACDVWWAPQAATTLGANSNFIGADVDAAGITIGSNVTWTGRALAFGGTVSTDTDTISAPSCTATPPNDEEESTPPTVNGTSGKSGSTGGTGLAATGQAVEIVTIISVSLMLLSTLLLIKMAKEEV